MKKKFFLWLFILAAIALFVFMAIVFSKNEPFYQPQQNIKAAIKIPEEGVLTIQEAEKIDRPIVALFYVDWCGYCRKFMPVFGEIAKLYKDKYTFSAINCDNPEYSEMLKKFHIMGFPSVFIIDNKINHKFILSPVVISEKSLLREELDNYINVRKNILK